MMSIKFERTVDRFGDPIYIATFTAAEDTELRLGVIEKGEWDMPKRVRYEVYLGDRKAPGAFPDTYEDTLAEAKEFVLLHAHGILLAALPRRGEASLKEKKRLKKLG